MEGAEAMVFPAVFDLDILAKKSVQAFHGKPDGTPSFWTAIAFPGCTAQSLSASSVKIP